MSSSKHPLKQIDLNSVRLFFSFRIVQGRRPQVISRVKKSPINGRKQMGNGNWGYFTLLVGILLVVIILSTCCVMLREGCCVRNGWRFATQICPVSVVKNDFIQQGCRFVPQKHVPKQKLPQMVPSQI